MSFVHLHTHTEYSLLDGAARIKNLVSRCADYGMPACAITDHGVMYGVIDFYQACKENNIKPIIGCEVYVTDDRFAHTGRRGDSACHLILLAENQTGYQNLCKLVSLASIEGFYFKPRVDHDLLARYREGLICTSACIGGEIPEAFLNGQPKRAQQIGQRYVDIFGRDNFFIELQDHGMSEEKIVMPQMIALAKDLGVGMIVTNDLHYVDAADAEMHDILLCCQTGKLRSDENRMRFPNDQFYLKTEQEMAALFPDHPEAMTNTLKIAERCNVEFNFGKLYMPVYDVPQGYTLNSYLHKLCEDGLRRRYDSITPDLQERLDYELGVINDLNFPGYFLIVWDMINYARQNDIPVGPGRGSAAGSLVAYSLGITDIDPIRYGLLFERFLNPERVTPPDIDTDISDQRRGEVVDYLVQKYGGDKVAQIITFNFLLMKGAVKSVARVLDMPYDDANRLVKLMPEENEIKEFLRRKYGDDKVPKHVSVLNAVEASPELQAEYNKDPLAREVLDVADKIQGMPSHCGKHAAGVAIAQNELITYMPVQKMGDEGSVVTQYPKEQVEMCGLVKMDLLGLRTLSVITDAVENVEKSFGIKVDIADIPLDDKKTFDMLSEGEAVAVFQLESDGMRRYLRDLQPERIEDIIAMVALYRPGPLGSGMVEDFIAGRHGKKTTYMHPLLEPILKETYGVILYQEQVMEIVRALGGFSLGKADMIRRAMGKKKMSIIDAARNDFVDGCLKNGLSKKLAGDIFELLKKFGEYGFNKSHSAAYGWVTYQTAWLKANYPAEFMAATMTSVMDTADKVPKYIEHCRAMGLEVLRPDINESGEKFNVVSGKIRYALSAVKNVGREASRRLTEEREKNGPYKSLGDLCERQTLNKKLLESLILCGALDSFGVNRATLLASLDKTLELSKRLADDKASDQLSLFDFGFDSTQQQLEVQLDERPEYQFKELLEMERSVLGFYISGHPFAVYSPYVKRKISHDLTRIQEATDGTDVTVSGFISAVQRRMTKAGQQMAIFTIEDEYASLRCTMFPRDYERLRDLLIEGRSMLLRGRVKNTSGVAEVTVADILPPCKMYLRLPSASAYGSIGSLRGFLTSVPGPVAVEAYYEDVQVYAPFPGVRGVELDNKVMDTLKSMLGEKNVAIR